MESWFFQKIVKTNVCQGWQKQTNKQTNKTTEREYANKQNGEWKGGSSYRIEI